MRWDAIGFGLLFAALLCVLILPGELAHLIVRMRERKAERAPKPVQRDQKPEHYDVQ